MSRGRCQCENGRHFDLGKRGVKPKAHQYGFCAELFTVNTPYGTFAVCYDCREDCYAEYKNRKPTPNSIEAIS